MTTDLDLVLSPPGGAIDIGSDNIPTGILRERAVELVVSVMGKKSQAEMTSFISEGLSQCVRKGLTAVQTNDVAALHSYRKLLQENSLPLRVFLTPNYEELNAVDLKSSSSEICSGGVGSAEWDCRPSRPSCMPSSSARITATKKASHNDDITHLPYSESTVIDLSTSRSRLVVERVKIYADGSLGAETAALRTTDILASSSQIDIGSDENRHVTDYISLPLLDLAQAGKNKDKGYTGILTHSKDDLKNMVSHARDLNFRVEVHAIGDAAAEQVRCN